MHIVDLQDKSTDAEPRWKAETNGLMRGFQPTVYLYRRLAICHEDDVCRL